MITETELLNLYRNEWIAYARHHLHMSYFEIALKTDLALSTTRSYASKYLPLLETEMVEMFQNFYEGLAVVAPPAQHTAIRRFADGAEIPMNFLPNCGADVPNAQQAYLFKFYDGSDTPIFSKIGTTTRSCTARLRQEIGEYRKKGFDIDHVDVCAIIQCGERPAEGHESYLRALLMNEYPNTWRRNDRFFDVDVSTERFMAICEEYFSRC